MKRIFALSVIIGFVVSLASSQENVRSLNTVTAHRHTVKAGELILVASTVDHKRGSTLEDILGDQLPVNSAVFVWNGTGYETATRAAFFGWSENILVPRGKAFFVQVAASPPGDVTFALTGEVPEAHNGGGTTTVSVAGISATTYPYPAEIEFGATKSAQDAPVNASVFFWNVSTQSYDAPTTKAVFSGWGDAETRVIEVGEGYFLDLTASTPDNMSSDEVEPYDLSM